MSRSLTDDSSCAFSRLQSPSRRIIVYSTVGEWKNVSQQLQGGVHAGASSPERRQALWSSGELCDVERVAINVPQTSKGPLGWPPGDTLTLLPPGTGSAGPIERAQALNGCVLIQESRS